MDDKKTTIILEIERKTEILAVKYRVEVTAEFSAKDTAMELLELIHKVEVKSS